MTGGGLHVSRPGLLTTVQDLGRWGHQVDAVPVAGPMDAFSHRLANHLVGNPPDAALLEITLIGPELVAETPVTMAVCGADFDVACDGETVVTGATFGVRAGQTVRFGRRHRGARAYLAVAGGILTAPVLGSRATHLVSRMGGLEGRALAVGDVDGQPRDGRGGDTWGQQQHVGTFPSPSDRAAHPPASPRDDRGPRWVDRGPSEWRWR